MDYKKYSLEQLSNWMHDAMSVDDATPQEVYDVIIGVVKENYYMYKQQASQAYELLSLMNGNGKGKVKEYDDCVDKILSCDKNDTSPECVKHWDDFWESPHNSNAKDKVVKWQLPVEKAKVFDTDETEYFVSFPQDLLEAASLKEGDTIEWIDRGDGSFQLKKVTEPLKMDEC